METKLQEHGLLFFGNQHETVPTRLLFDPYLTSRAKLAWQLIKYKAREFQSGMFPSYEVLAKLLSDKPYDEAELSRKLVSQTLLLLRLTRWLTLCETVRNEQGQVLGNFYILHDEPMPIIDTIQLNHDYIALLEKSIQHRDNFVRGVANHIVETCSRIILSGIIFLTLTGCELAFKTIKNVQKWIFQSKKNQHLFKKTY